MLEQIDRLVEKFDISPEQLIKRIISSGLAEFDHDTGSALPGKTLEDFLVINGVWKEDE